MFFEKIKKAQDEAVVNLWSQCLHDAWGFLMHFLSKIHRKEAAETFYFSDDYQAARVTRDTGCDTDLMIIEGM